MNKILHSIPFNRLILYVMLLGFLPFLYVPFHYFSAMNQLKKTEAYLEKVEESAVTKEQKQEINTIVRAIYGKADPKYIENKIEKLQLLKREKEALEKMMKECAFPGGASNEVRYKFLTGEENRIRFTPGAVQTKEKIEETIETLSHPVEVDSSDLKNILQLIEEKQVGQPELLITDFKLNKKITPNKREVYELHMQLIKREFLS